MNIQNAKYILPNLFTLGSVILGVQAIAWSFAGQFVAAGIAVLMLAHGDGRPMERALDVTASWLTAGPRRPVDASSWWQLRRDADGR